MTRRYDPTQLHRGLVHEPIPRAYRIIRSAHAATPLGSRPAPSRFSDPRGKFAVLYAAHDVETVLWEAVLRDRPATLVLPSITRAELDQYLIVELRSTRPLRLLDLSRSGPRAITAPTAVVGDRRHRAGQALSGALHALLAYADGVLYPSRFTQAPCIAVYERSLSALSVREVSPLITAPEVLDVLVKANIRITGAPG